MAKSDGPREAMVDPEHCQCGHSREEHDMLLPRLCQLPGCSCDGFEKLAPQD